MPQESMSVPRRVTPCYPYEGALYWFFSDASLLSYDGRHPYYLSLYGPQHELLVPRATALVALFDEIELAPADAALPDFSSYESGDDYRHPDLRLSRSWKHREWDRESEALAEWLLSQPGVLAALTAIKFEESDDFTMKHFLCRTLLQMRVAADAGSVLIGDSTFQAVVNQVLQHTNGDVGIDDAPPLKGSWELEPRVLDIVGLNFSSRSIDSFAAIRRSREISNYAEDFRSAVSRAVLANDAGAELRRLMRQALEHDEVRANASDAFQAVGSAANWGGFLPFWGTFTTAAGVIADAASRKLKASSEDCQWYLLGPRMNEIALKDALLDGDERA